MASVYTLSRLQPERRRVAFSREELRRLIDVYSRGVAAGEWRDYAIEHDDRRAAFYFYRRTMERPFFVVEKRPAEAGFRFALGRGPRILRRARALGPILEAIARRPRLVRA